MPVTPESDPYYRLRHSLAHIMAQAVLEEFPEGKAAIGPPIEDGFYYDFDLPRALTPEDLDAVQRRMRRIIGGNYPFVRREVSADEARGLFASQPYKLELIDGLVRGADEYGEAEDGTAGAVDRDPAHPGGVVISTYKQNTFEDLCRGPHLERTGQIPPDGFKLLSIAGAYWRGDEKRPQLQRIYGTAWNSKAELEAHLQRLEEAKRRDHRKLGKELEIFFFDDEVGQGLPLWLPNGAIIIDELEKLAMEIELKAGYQRVRTPHITKEDLFLRSGHLPYYAEDMYPPMELEGTRYYLKPMNCPMHHKIFGNRPRSYRELPLRLTEYGTCYRYEQSGALFGIMRARSLEMNDAHIYCTEEQFEEEFLAVVDLYLANFKLFGIDKYVMRLSTHSPEGLGKKYVDSPELWLKTEEMVRRAMTNGNIPFVEVPNEAAFYGPKIDVQIWSAIGREFTLATNQVDFAVPARFNLTYTNREGQEETPLCIHRAPLSTHERMIGFLLEHYAGAFPTWLAPVQAALIPISDEKHGEYGRQLQARMQDAGLRAELDASKDRMQAKIRRAQLQKIPYMLIIGDKELAADAVAVRLRSGEDLGAVPVSSIIERLRQEVATRA
ncbi:MAG: threonine--tRNA ligase [Chloroflexales bacterium]|nr:threonine--tRNA ligase [Chloroflexales bacterium]